MPRGGREIMNLTLIVKECFKGGDTLDLKG